MSKQVNQNIGHIDCFICGSQSAVRKNKNDKLYYDCLDCGRITPNHQGGQDAVVDNAVIWGADGAPANVRRWIAEQWSYQKSMTDPQGLKTLGEYQVVESDSLPTEKNNEAVEDEVIVVGQENPKPRPEQKPMSEKKSFIDSVLL